MGSTRPCQTCDRHRNPQMSWRSLEFLWAGQLDFLHGAGPEHDGFTQTIMFVDLGSDAFEDDPF